MTATGGVLTRGTGRTGNTFKLGINEQKKNFKGAVVNLLYSSQFQAVFFQVFFDNKPFLSWKNLVNYEVKNDPFFQLVFNIYGYISLVYNIFQYQKQIQIFISKLYSK